MNQSMVYQHLVDCRDRLAQCKDPLIQAQHEDYIKTIESLRDVPDPYAAADAMLDDPHISNATRTAAYWIAFASL